jgi:hypothetical protein
MLWAVLALLLAGLTPHITVATSASTNVVRPGARVSLFVDVMPDPKIHVYAPGAKDYLPISLELAPSSGVKAGKLTYPKSQILNFEPLNDRVPVYRVPFRLTQDLTVNPSAKAGQKITVIGELKYQACDDAVCFKPASAPVSWTLDVK